MKHKRDFKALEKRRLKGAKLLGAYPSPRSNGDWVWPGKRWRLEGTAWPTAAKTRLSTVNWGVSATGYCTEAGTEQADRKPSANPHPCPARIT